MKNLTKKKWVKVIERLRRINSVANIYKWWILNAGRYLVDFIRKMRGEKSAEVDGDQKFTNFSFFSSPSDWWRSSPAACVLSLSYTKDINAKMLFNFAVRRRCLTLCLCLSPTFQKSTSSSSSSRWKRKKIVNEV